MTVTQPQQLADRVAVQADVPVPVVQAVMAAYGIAAVSAPTGRRSLRVARLRMIGIKHGVPGDGPFDKTLEFPTGVVMAVGPNLRGKSSLLEVLTWCLRGSARDLQRDVASWLTQIECDVQLGPYALAFRLDLQDGQIRRGAVYQAASLADLAHAAAHESPLFEAGSDQHYADAVEALMLDRLDLEPLHANDRRLGVQQHGWPTYFGAIYPAAGGERVLLGETEQAGLPGRLLTVFLDLPRAAIRTRVRTALTQLREAQHVPDTVQRRDRLRTRQQAALAAAREQLAALPDASGPSVPQLATRVAALGSDLAEAESVWREAGSAYRQAKLARQDDERALTTLNETVVAERLFHGLNPTSCPRCESPVGAQRRARETTEHVCAVCTSPLEGPEDEAEAQEQQHEREEALRASRAAETTALQAFEQAEATLTRLSREVEDADGALAAARSARAITARADLEAQIARAEGALAVLAEDEAEAEADTATSQTPGGQVGTPAQTVATPAQVLAVLTALDKEFEAELRAVSTELLTELGVVIADLARAFGMDAVTEVKPDLRAALRITKGGTPAGGFGAQSPGERLRLRLATVLALLRVGAQRGIATHPGLLMLDSLRAEEVQDADAHAVLDALVAIAAETPGLQIITTTADETLPDGRLDDEHVLRPDRDTGALW